MGRSVENKVSVVEKLNIAVERLLRSDEKLPKTIVLLGPQSRIIIISLGFERRVNDELYFCTRSLSRRV